VYVCVCVRAQDMYHFHPFTFTSVMQKFITYDDVHKKLSERCVSGSLNATGSLRGVWNLLTSMVILQYL